MFSPLFHLHNQFMEIIPINQQFRIVAGIRLDSFGEEAFPVNRKYFPERLHGNVFPTPAGSGGSVAKSKRPILIRTTDAVCFFTGKRTY